MSKGVALITGVGPGTGASLVRKFASDGYQVAMLARNAERLERIGREVPGTHAYPTDVKDAAQLAATVEKIAQTIGAPSIVIHNAVGGAFGNFLDIDPDVLRHNFEVNVMALLNLSRQVAPQMIRAGKGAIIATGNTASIRGKANFAGFAPTKAAQRILAESIARELGPKGIHVGFVMIDAVIDVEWARKRYPEASDDFFIKPSDIAEEVHHIAHQPKSAWSFLTEIRPFGEKW